MYYVNNVSNRYTLYMYVTEISLVPYDAASIRPPISQCITSFSLYVLYCVIYSAY